MLDIIDLKDGETVTGPGAYRCSMAHYHSQDICPGPSVSSTGLRKIAMQSPHAFWKTWDGNPNRYPEKELGDSLILGRASHALILGDEVFDEHFIYVPEDAPQRPTATQVKAYERDGKWSASAQERADFWVPFDKKAEGRLELTAAQVQKIQYMSENLAANPLCVELLKSDLVEISLIWQDEATGIWVKSRPDCIPSNGFDFGDLKTFAPKGSDLILAAQRATTDHGYPMQMALATMGSEIVFNTTARECGLAFVQTSEPYEAIPLEIDEESMYWAQMLCRSALDKMAECLKSGDWHGIGHKMVRYSYPPSMLHKFGEMQIAGDLSNEGWNNGNE